jgi:sortase A
VLDPPAKVAGGAVAPPRNSYAPEPIQEIGTIEIPKIGLVHKVMHGVTLRNIDHGPSHWPGTPMPGEAGNTVFAGHRVTHSHPFRRINELVPGDEIFFTVAGVRSRYVVTGHEVVSPSRVDIVYPTPTPTVTLFACHPPGSARQRYVVRGALASLDGSPAAAPEPAAAEPDPAPAPAPEG